MAPVLLLLTALLGCPKPAPAVAAAQPPKEDAPIPSSGIHQLFDGPHTIRDRPEAALQELRDSGWLPDGLDDRLPSELSHVDATESWRVDANDRVFHGRRLVWRDRDLAVHLPFFYGFEPAEPHPSACADYEEFPIQGFFADPSTGATLCIQRDSGVHREVLLTHYEPVRASRASLTEQLPAILDAHEDSALLTTPFLALAECVREVRVEHNLAAGGIWLWLDGTCSTDQLARLEPWCEANGLRVLERGGCTGTSGYTEVQFGLWEGGAFTLMLDL